jgi:hypothetical protein
MRLLRFLVGIAVLLFLGAGFKALLSGLHPEPLFRFVSYALLGLWCGFGAPWSFLKLGIMEREP